MGYESTAPYPLDGLPDQHSDGQHSDGPADASDAASQAMAQRQPVQVQDAQRIPTGGFAVIDVETTGFSPHGSSLGVDLEFND